MQHVPDEIVEHIFDFLSAHTLATLSIVSKRLRRLSNKNSLWRRHCRDHWRYWHPRHNIHQLLRAPAIETEWKPLYILRDRQDQEITLDFEQVLSKQSGRIPHIENIARHSHDAKDALLEFSRCPDASADVLARRYWANEILGSIEREAAIMTWEKVSRGEDVPLEHALGSLDLWITQQPSYDLDDISVVLDILAESFLIKNDDMESVRHWCTRKKATKLWSFLNDFKSIRHPSASETHRSLQNNIIGAILGYTDHEFSPTIGAAVYCCIARRIGLNAHLTNYPFHVYINIPADEGFDHNGHPSIDPVNPLFIEPWSGCETSSHTLEVQLRRMGQPESSFADYLRPASVLELIHRVANNIQAAVQELGPNSETVHYNTSRIETRGRRQYDTGSVESYAINSPIELSPIRAAYCVCWLQIALRLPPNSIRAIEGTQISIHLVNLLIQQIGSYNHDIPLVEKYILPRFSKNSMEHEHLSTTVSKRLRMEDNTIRAVHRRPSVLNGIKGPHNNFLDTVKYRIGDVFRHKRYNYTAIIIGWDPACMASQSWIDHMGIESLPGGREQSFYNVFVEDLSTRYVAEENISRLSEGTDTHTNLPNSGLMREAGRWFKRFDLQHQKFISNMVDEYPDD